MRSGQPSGVAGTKELIFEMLKLVQSGGRVAEAGGGRVDVQGVGGRAWGTVVLAWGHGFGWL